MSLRTRGGGCKSVAAHGRIIVKCVVFVTILRNRTNHAFSTFSTSLLKERSGKSKFSWKTRFHKKIWNIYEFMSKLPCRNLLENLVLGTNGVVLWSKTHKKTIFCCFQKTISGLGPSDGPGPGQDQARPRPGTGQGQDLQKIHGPLFHVHH